ncbi:hypothetical protein [Mycolicibacterium sp. J2]|jgi:hypothetical protein|nr:hypothetical protein [Mycolicibacterium sp. J2]MCX2714113.1 hypothetical protein [Mycolicibacterium sp. J2]
MTTVIKAISASILSAGVLGAAALGLVGAAGGVADLETTTSSVAQATR